MGLSGDRWLRPVGWATLVMNAVLVGTGGAVRLTGSGLGCPTWPRCQPGHFTPHGAMDVHSVIEFGNRMLTFVLVAVAIATAVAVFRSSRRDLRSLSILLGLSIPVQAVVGGITVLTGLNPWVVSFHLLASMAIIALAVLFLWRLDHVVRRPAPVAVAAYVAGWAVLYLGTVVTGSGPHAGSIRVDRNGLDPLQMSQLHTDVVFLFVGLVAAMVLVPVARRAALAVLGVSSLQAVVGFVQYFSDLPIVLVGLHMVGAALIAATATWLLLVSGETQPAASRS